MIYLGVFCVFYSWRLKRRKSLINSPQHTACLNWNQNAQKFCFTMLFNALSVFKKHNLDFFSSNLKHVMWIYYFVRHKIFTCFPFVLLWSTKIQSYFWILWVRSRTETCSGKHWWWQEGGREGRCSWKSETRSRARSPCWRQRKS